MQRLYATVRRTMKRISRLAGLALLLVPLHVVPQVQVPPSQQDQARSTPPALRGELLYRNHCISCHSTSVHWRDRRLVTDFGSLIAQVGRWERNTGLGWSSEEILDVVQYLNATIYRFPDPAPLQKG